MDTLSIQRRILATDLMPTEKLVGMALALHMNVKAGHIRMKQETIAKECGFSRRTVVRAVLALVAAGGFESRRTGRTALLVPAESSAGARVTSEVSPMSQQAAKRERFMGMPADQHTSGRAVQARGGEVCESCPTSCPFLGPSGCTVACGKEEIECPVI
mgnify:CR=1 FL=1